MGSDINEINKSLVKIGLNNDLKKDVLEKCLKDESIQDRILTERINAQKKYKISSTPTIYVNDKKYEGKNDYISFKKYLKKISIVMKFKKLEITGFKSFFEKTTFLIEDGLTGIVGPNGCSKSNIVESLRWCMGETSAKSMRGSGMEDVIFSGTSSRAPKNISEVSILIDNFDKDGPSQFKELDEVIVRRKLREIKDLNTTLMIER